MKLSLIGLHNFGSFADATVSLDGVSAAVVTGQNGAGKSTAFIDAITWALFGVCRVPMDEMLRLGTSEMAVTIGFRLAGTDYRVIRKRSLATKAGKSELALQVRNGEGWTDASGARLPETQEKICALLNMDYDLLVSTGFLVQGQADRFTRASASERKTILSQILRLDRYPRLRSLAFAEGTSVQAQRTQVDARLDALAVVIAERASFEQQIKRGQDAEHMAAGAVVEVEAAIETGRARVTELTLAVRNRAQWQAELEELCTRHARLMVRVSAVQERQARAGKILAEREKIVRKVHEEQGFVKQLADVTAQGQAAHERTIGIAQALAGMSAALAQGGERRAAVQDCENNLRLAEAFLEQKRSASAAEIAQVEKAAGMLALVPCGAELQGRCRFTKDAVEQQARLPGLRAEAEAPGEVPCGFRERLGVAREALGQWEAEAWPAQAAALIAEQGLVGDQYRAARAKQQGFETCLVEVRRFTVLIPELERAAQDTEACRVEAAALAVEVREVVAHQGVVGRRLEMAVAEGLQEIQEGVRLAVARLEGLRVARESLVLEEGRLRARLEAVVLAEGERGRLQEQADMVLDSQLWRAQQLAEAYGRIPVLILESAVPALEQETNRILAKVSRAGMTVRIETQKALKSRDGLAETLDIIVRDVHGERRYEAYSGGEQFRLNLALRIGLSKLLAHRAGATLDTLVIDEGLGSLDPDALAQVRACLSALQEEFPLLLVVTHVEAMVDTFPTEIVVSGGTGGSTIEVRG